MAEWVRVDDGGGERWHRLTDVVHDDGKSEAVCGMIVPVHDTMETLSDPPFTLQHPECRETPPA